MVGDLRATDGGTRSAPIEGEDVRNVPAGHGKKFWGVQPLRIRGLRVRNANRGNRLRTIYDYSAYTPDQTLWCDGTNQFTRLHVPNQQLKRILNDVERWPFVAGAREARRRT